MLVIYNSLTQQKETFHPLQPGQVKIYVCGITVYDYCHMGHAKSMVSFDVVVRYLRSQGYQVTHVRNITDIDDKIIQRAQANNESIEALTERFIGAMNEDAQALGLLVPTVEPRATQYMSQILAMIQRLLDQSYAYITASGDVYYRVDKFEHYGCLSHKKLDELQVGKRVDVDEQKENPLDFVLWKSAKPGEPAWNAPWGQGRPGWHIECSAMSTHCLGETFDIHGGGADLLFPHHENEIAQAEAATQKPYVRYWMHNGFIQINEEKMSKSLGNFFTIREVLKKYSGEVLRYFIIASHYRSQLNYSDENLQQAQESLTRLYLTLRDVNAITELTEDSAALNEYIERFYQVMDDDFNTPKALSVLHELATEVNRFNTTDPVAAAGWAFVLRKLAHILGLLEQRPQNYFNQSSTEEAAIIEQLIAARIQARVEKQWQRADQIRDQLLSMGILLEDKEGKTVWRRK